MIGGERPVSDKLLVVKNLFTVEELTEDATKLLECEDVLREECEKYGKVKKVKVYDVSYLFVLFVHKRVVPQNNTDGVAMVTYATPQEADNALTMLDYRMLRGRCVVFGSVKKRQSYPADNYVWSAGTAEHVTR